MPNLLQVIMQNDVDLPVRQAGAIYMKNMICNNWQDKDPEPGTPLAFAVHEQDRAMVRESIVEAIVLSPDMIKVQLCVCLNHIIKCDFPGRWTQIVDKINIYLQNSDVNGWNGALLCMYQLVKNYEYKKPTERTPLVEAMNLLLPLIYNLIINLLNEPSDQSLLLQKQILKIYYALTQYALPLNVISREMFAQWMEICRQILDRPAPDSTAVDEDERPELPCWKTKKWATHIITRMFERYGSPGNVISKEYEEFAKWYLETFSAGMLEVILKVFDQYRQQVRFSFRNHLLKAKTYIFLNISGICVPSCNDRPAELSQNSCSSCFHVEIVEATCHHSHPRRHFPVDVLFRVGRGVMGGRSCRIYPCQVRCL